MNVIQVLLIIIKIIEFIIKILQENKELKETIKKNGHNNNKQETGGGDKDGYRNGNISTAC